MTTQTLTLPPISQSLQDTIRAYGLANGWKNAARELAYGPVRGGTKLEQVERDYRKVERREAELYLAEDNPVLAYCGYRQVWRFRRPRSNYGALPERPRPTPVEQVTVTERLAGQLKERGVKVAQDRRTGTWWADVEDEVWGADDWITECFGARAGQPGYTADDALSLLRKADEARRCAGIKVTPPRSNGSTPDCSVRWIRREGGR